MEPLEAANGLKGRRFHDLQGLINSVRIQTKIECIVPTVRHPSFKFNFRRKDVRVPRVESRYPSLHFRQCPSRTMQRRLHTIKVRFRLTSR